MIDSGRGASEPNSQTMANEAFEAAVGSADLDLEVYDNDGNGYVSCTGRYQERDTHLHVPG